MASIDTQDPMMSMSAPSFDSSNRLRPGNVKGNTRRHRPMAAHPASRRRRVPHPQPGGRGGPRPAARLKVHSGRVIDIRWATGTAGVLPAFLGRVFQGDATLPPIRLLITPAGLFEAVAELAEVASWMMKNLRWDIQDDVARFLGNTPAELLRKVGEGIREALQRWRPGNGAPR